MVEIDNDTIYLTWGNQLTLNLEIDNYTFISGDKIRFAIYDTYELNNKPVLEKNILVTNTSESVDIVLSTNDTKIGEKQNKIVTYWYEIDLNDKYTILGYKKEGPSMFNILPKGDVKNET